MTKNEKNEKSEKKPKPVRTLGKDVLRQVNGGAGITFPSNDGSSKDAG